MTRMMAIFAFLGLLATPLAAEERYILLTLSGSVNPISADYLVRGIENAPKEGAEFVVILIDTPGGMVNSMRDINKAIMTSDLPVVVYTYPKGAQAASAGAYIMLAAHVAVMAPGTEIGAMHPVGPSLDFLPRDERGDPAGPMEKKVLNMMISYARSLAQERNRNVKWAEDAVKRAVTSTYLEAKRNNVIDLIADDMDDLMTKLHNRRVMVKGKPVVIRTASHAPLAIEMDWKERFLNFFADPQIVLFLLLIAAAGIGFEIKNPGMIFPGVAGGIALFLFLMAVRILPVNIAGIALILVAVALLVLELYISSYGLLTIGGIAAFVFGSMILFDSPLTGGSIPMTTIIAMALILLGFIFIVVRAVVRVHKGQVTTGVEGIVGEEGIVLVPFDGRGRGKVSVHGEIWDALCEEPAARDDAIVVTGVSGMILTVKKK